MKEVISCLNLYQNSYIIFKINESAQTKRLLQFLTYFKSPKILVHLNLFKYHYKDHYDSLTRVLTHKNFNVVSISTYDQIFLSDNETVIKDIKFQDYLTFDSVCTMALQRFKLSFHNCEFNFEFRKVEYSSR